MRTWEKWTKLFKEQNRETNQMPPSFYDASPLSIGRNSKLLYKVEFECVFVTN